jgi:nicotinate phosphoribosyltransferase
LITSHGDPALGGVYKLVAIADGGGLWQPAIKISENIEKIPVPGEKKVTRVYDNRGLATADIIALADEEPSTGGRLELFHPFRDVHRTIEEAEISDSEELLEPSFSDGKRLDGTPELEVMRDRRKRDLERLDPGVRRLVNPHIYHVSLTRKMKELQNELVQRLGHGDTG